MEDGSQISSGVTGSQVTSINSCTYTCMAVSTYNDFATDKYIILSTYVHIYTKDVIITYVFIKGCLPYATLLHTTPHHPTLHHTTPHHPTPHHTTPHHPTLHHTTPQHTTLHYTTPHHPTLHHTKLQLAQVDPLHSFSKCLNAQLCKKDSQALYLGCLS